jgi:hypothetical protein
VKEWEKFYEINNEKGFVRYGHVCGEDYFGPRDINRDSQRIKLGTATWDGGTPAEERWEYSNSSLGHTKCTLIN